MDKKTEVKEIKKPSKEVVKGGGNFDIAGYTKNIFIYLEYIA